MYRRTKCLQTYRQTERQRDRRTESLLEELCKSKSLFYLRTLYRLLHWIILDSIIGSLQINFKRIRWLIHYIIIITLDNNRYSLKLEPNLKLFPGFQACFFTCSLRGLEHPLFIGLDVLAVWWPGPGAGGGRCQSPSGSWSPWTRWWLLGRRIWRRYAHSTVGAASQWWSNERMMVYFKLMMVKCLSMMVKWYDHTLIWPSLTSISPSLALSKPSLAHLTIIEKLHRLQYRPIVSIQVGRNISGTIFKTGRVCSKSGTKSLVHWFQVKFLKTAPKWMKVGHTWLVKPNNVIVLSIFLYSYN